MAPGSNHPKKNSCPLYFTVAYNGLKFSGWQRQKNGYSVVQALEEKWRLYFQESGINILGATRTDRGTHALAQSAVALLTKESLRKIVEGDGPLRAKRILHSLNGLLKPDIKLAGLATVPEGFQVRFHTLRKSYFYKLYLDDFPHPLNPCALPVGSDFSLKRLKGIFGVLRGYRDFRSFARKSSVKDKDTRRLLFPVKIIQKSREAIIVFQGTGFLHNQIRVMVGTAIALTRELKLSLDGARIRMKEILDDRDRLSAGKTAPAHPLFLHKVIYPKDIRGKFKYLI